MRSAYVLPHPLRGPALVIPTLAAAAAWAGAEEPLHDLRLVVEARPAAFSYDWSIYGSRRQGSDSSELAYAAGAGLRWGWGRAGSPHLAFVGAEALAVEETYGDGGRSGWIGRGEAGWAWASSGMTTLTANAFGGGGWSTFRMPDGAIGGRNLSGTSIEYGCRAGIRLRLESPWSLGIESGWIGSHERYQDGDASLAVTRQGLWIGLAAGYVLGDRPRAID